MCPECGSETKTTTTQSYESGGYNWYDETEYCTKCPWQHTTPICVAPIIPEEETNDKG